MSCVDSAAGRSATPSPSPVLVADWEMPQPYSPCEPVSLHVRHPGRLSPPWKADAKGTKPHE
ncbi:uncharacterized protein PHALS_06272 [Plasmopara halstedii]|uniref:Uncharacterized protein n=1 Tax=Plasmopara halstedii TaxID=4781 RepID=A0A0P1B4C2_PLAHL|nr:uncharacterized protein PHALS_06272 [Plasmopara halstedii]CEG48452.1 hypothetical protein PHALS_06272 [Plasmopara halstedii]|eukprot:XP_024584821.1 hypothetical protein PHALS_06272 [Plasmopara halstedii]